jgi:hypothetical protein
MTLVVRRLAAAGCLGLVASLAACSDDEGGSDGSGGSGSGSPSDASLDDFCTSFNGLFDRVLSEEVAGDQAATVRALKEWARDIEDVGTPADMPDDARHGFELFIEQARDIDEDATLAELEQFGEDVSEADRADGDAFSDWTQDNCPLALPELPSGS